MGHRLRWLGHSGWEIVASNGRRLLVDPWLRGNPVAPMTIQDLDPADYVFITHDHADHAGDVVEIMKETGATLVGQPELVARYVALYQQEMDGNGGPDPVEMNIGGTVELNGLSVTMTDAYHSSETGTPTGYILTLADGCTIYHMGDTGLHANMATWGELFDLDVVLIPIGDRFTMGAQQAARALRWLKPKIAIPMHYKTFPILAPSADDFVRRAQELAPDVTIQVLNPGDWHAIE